MFETLIPHDINLIQQKKINIPPTMVIQMIHREKPLQLERTSRISARCAVYILSCSMTKNIISCMQGRLNVFWGLRRLLK